MSQAEEEVKRVEGVRMAALVNKDVAELERLHAEDYQLINPAGQTLSKRRYVDSIASGSLEY